MMRTLVISSTVALLAGGGISLLLMRRRRRRRERKGVAKVVIIFSGKRKSGKDYCSDALLALFSPGVAEIGRLSGPLKRAYAQENGLNYEQLLDATRYKETHRKEMISWGEARRSVDPGYFASLVLEDAKSPVLIVSDARRPTDLQFFKERIRNVFTVRVVASDETRADRGWNFTQGVDDGPSECGLDAYNSWDFVIHNEPDLLTETDSNLRDLAAGALHLVDQIDTE